MYLWVIKLLFSVYCTSVDQIYHLASPASPPNYMYNPVKTIKTNTLGTNNMLGTCNQIDLTKGCTLYGCYS